jgi:hypothetical protein
MRAVLGPLSCGHPDEPRAVLRGFSHTDEQIERSGVIQYMIPLSSRAGVHGQSRNGIRVAGSLRQYGRDARSFRGAPEGQAERLEVVELEPACGKGCLMLASSSQHGSRKPWGQPADRERCRGEVFNKHAPRRGADDQLAFERDWIRVVPEFRPSGTAAPTRSPLSTQGDSRDRLPGKLVAHGHEPTQVVPIRAHREESGPQGICREGGKHDALPIW